MFRPHFRLTAQPSPASSAPASTCSAQSTERRHLLDTQHSVVRGIHTRLRGPFNHRRPSA
jgi:hypothetical protein